VDELETGPVVAPAKGPRGRRRGRGARERILHASEHLFREQGIHNTGIDQLCEVANVSRRTAYQHFGSKDGIVAEYLRQCDPDTMPDVFDRTDLTARERLLAAFETPQSVARRVTPLCPFIAAAVEIPDPDHQARIRVRDYKSSVAARLAETAREAGAAEPEELGEQLALLLDGASARTRALNADAFHTAAAIAAALIERALPPDADPDPAGLARRQSSSSSALTRNLRV
jgi:AcrR family transcriptional regulator